MSTEQEFEQVERIRYFKTRNAIKGIKEKIKESEVQYAIPTFGFMKLTNKETGSKSHWTQADPTNLPAIFEEDEDGDLILRTDFGGPYLVEEVGGKGIIAKFREKRVYLEEE